MSSPDALAIIALCARDLDSSADAFSDKEAWNLLELASESGIAPEALTSGDGPETIELGLEERQRLEARMSEMGQAQSLVEELRELGIWVATPFDGGFPARLRERLGASAPCLLYGAGDARLLAEDGVGVVGARDLSPDGAEVAAQIGSLVAAEGLTLVSGGARGVDQIALSAAAERGGNVVGVLPGLLQKRVRETESARLLEEGKLCLVSPFKPSAPFSVGGAMARNKIIYAVSRCTVVVAADAGRGGTWAGATEALRRGFGPVAVWTGPGSGAGNQQLIPLGGIPITDPSAVVEIKREASQATPADPQLAFGLD